MRGAAEGDEASRAEFARHYAPILRAYFGARWRGSPLQAEVDDAVQEVFVDFFKEDGALHRLDSGRAGGFRPFLYGVARTVGLRCETRRARRQEEDAGSGIEHAVDEDTLSYEFDRAWALRLVERASEEQTEAARRAGPEAARRVELLRLRFHDQMPIRDIAKLWNVSPARLHREYRKARIEFRQALFRTVAFHAPSATSVEIEKQCESILDYL